MRGRKPKPTPFKVLAGTVQKCRSNPNEPHPDEALPSCPEHLDPTARAEWKRLAQGLHLCGVLTAVDRSTLGAYCQAYSRWARAELRLAEEELVLEGDTGYRYQNPWVNVANKAMEMMNRFAVELGITPASRSRIHATPRHQETADEKRRRQLLSG